MADVVRLLLSFPPDKKASTPKEYDTHVSSHIKEVRKIQDSAWQKAIDKKPLLELLDPAVNSISYLFALLHAIKTNAKDQKRLRQLTDLASVFVTVCDPVQMRYVGYEWRNIFEWVASSVAQWGLPDVRTLVHALLRIDRSAGTFTSCHLRVVQLCLQCSCPSVALLLLDKDVHAYPQNTVKNVVEEIPADQHELSNAYITERSGFSESVTSEMVLEYYLLGAIVYIGQRIFNRARLFLEFVILSPSQLHTVSGFQVEAYKKWVLIGLLAEGRTFPLPRTFDQATMKNIKSMCKAYDVLADDFEKRDYPKYLAEMQTGGQLWQDDGNLSLVKEAADALLRYRVIDLQKTYSALPVARVATLTSLSPDHTLQMLSDMISRGYLNASIMSSGPDAVLRFRGPSTTLSPGEHLETQTKRITDLIAYIRDADRRLQLTKEYSEFQKRSKRIALDGDVADQMDLTYDAPSVAMELDADEDIMS